MDDNDMIQCCCSCKWHDDFSGVCFNGESDARGDFTLLEDYCGCWEGKDHG